MNRIRRALTSPFIYDFLFLTTTTTTTPDTKRKPHYMEVDTGDVLGVGDVFDVDDGVLVGVGLGCRLIILM